MRLLVGTENYTRSQGVLILETNTLLKDIENCINVNKEDIANKISSRACAKKNP